MGPGIRWVVSARGSAEVERKALRDQRKPDGVQPGRAARGAAGAVRAAAVGARVGAAASRSSASGGARGSRRTSVVELADAPRELAHHLPRPSRGGPRRRCSAVRAPARSDESRATSPASAPTRRVWITSAEAGEHQQRRPAARSCAARSRASGSGRRVRRRRAGRRRSLRAGAHGLQLRADLAHVRTGSRASRGSSCAGSSSGSCAPAPRPSRCRSRRGCCRSRGR